MTEPTKPRDERCPRCGTPTPMHSVGDVVCDGMVIRSLADQLAALTAERAELVAVARAAWHYRSLKSDPATCESSDESYRRLKEFGERKWSAIRELDAALASPAVQAAIEKDTKHEV